MNATNNTLTSTDSVTKLQESVRAAHFLSKGLTTVSDDTETLVNEINNGVTEDFFVTKKTNVLQTINNTLKVVVKHGDSISKSQFVTAPTFLLGKIAKNIHVSAIKDNYDVSLETIYVLSEPTEKYMQIDSKVLTEHLQALQTKVQSVTSYGELMFLIYSNDQQLLYLDIHKK